MQFLLLASLVPLLGLASAAPSLPIYRITPRVNNNGTAATNGTAAAAATTQLTFTGAGATFSVNAPTDGSNFQIRTSDLGHTMPPPPPKFMCTPSWFLTKLHDNNSQLDLGRPHRAGRHGQLPVQGRERCPAGDPRGE